jgi:hypothetical protein
VFISISATISGPKEEVNFERSKESWLLYGVMIPIFLEANSNGYLFTKYRALDSYTIVNMSR